jgi:hypothetical protein
MHQRKGLLRAALARSPGGVYGSAVGVQGEAMEPQEKAELHKLEPLVGLVQHYFDSRGVVRRYATSIEDGVWSLRKLTPGFAQRFLAEFSADGETIEGAWEKADDGVTWEHDFTLVHRKVV